jgi:hypothetical protein
MGDRAGLSTLDDKQGGVAESVAERNKKAWPKPKSFRRAGNSASRQRFLAEPVETEKRPWNVPAYRGAGFNQQDGGEEAATPQGDTAT